VRFVGQSVVAKDRQRVGNLSVELSEPSTAHHGTFHEHGRAAMGQSSNRAVRILVVDRDPHAGQQIRNALQSEGYHCEYSTNAAGALTQARQHMPALMIVNTQLDACSGFELADTVCSEYPRQDIPVIFISESRTGDSLAESQRAGGIYFLSKPIDPSVLFELVDKALWMPHLIRRHIDAAAHPSGPKPPRVLSDKAAARTKLLS
jgi:PleD family two-component response regulator